VTIDEIRRVLFVGAGQMGCANSLVAAVSGYDVVLYDVGRSALDAVPATHDAIGAYLVDLGYCSGEQLDQARVRVALEPDLDRALAGIDLVSESIIEDREVKREVFALLDQLADDHTILTTNTSALLVSDLEDAVERGDRFAALHSHLGALLFDIVGGPRTSPATIDTLRRYVESLQGIPLVLEVEHPGYVFNSLNGAVLETALTLVVDGDASVESVDRAWMTTRGAPMGPFGMIDLFGLDLVATAYRNPTDDPARAERAPRLAALLDRAIEAGDLGVKSGRGFYTHPNPAYEGAGWLGEQPVGDEVGAALTAALVSRAVAVVDRGVAPPETVDLAWTTATGLDIGPFGILRQLTPTSLKAMLGAQVDRGLVTVADADAVLAAQARANPV
jgi:3-hydroxybutyryl-CoA dehydrogenase